MLYFAYRIEFHQHLLHSQVEAKAFAFHCHPKCRTWSLVIIDETFLRSATGGTSACDFGTALTNSDVC